MFWKKKLYAISGNKLFVFDLKEEKTYSPPPVLNGSPLISVHPSVISGGNLINALGA